MLPPSLGLNGSDVRWTIQVRNTGTFEVDQCVVNDPDLLTTAKGLAGGVPAGAVLMRSEIAN